jgi:hypothetical protein
MSIREIRETIYYTLLDENRPGEESNYTDQNSRVFCLLELCPREESFFSAF